MKNHMPFLLLHVFFSMYLFRGKLQESYDIISVIFEAHFD